MSNSTKSAELQITFLQPQMFYNRYVKYVFSDNGTKIFDRGKRKALDAGKMDKFIDFLLFLILIFKWMKLIGHP